MRRLVYLVFFSTAFWMACDEVFETAPSASFFEYQPLSVGNFWIYEVQETIHFGENDSETSNFFYRDRIRSTYLNAQNELVYIVERAKSSNRQNWIKEKEYTLEIRNNSVVRTMDNRSLVVLSFPADLGRKWNGLIYQAEGDDEFEIDSVSNLGSGSDAAKVIRVNQEELDDKVTLRDIRREIFEEGKGLIEKYDEVVTYCSRNNCLGQQIIDGGSKVSMKLIDYEIR